MRPSSDAAVKALRRAKPLFCPLKTEYYEAFERGEKHSELRRYGGAWNETVCFVGRAFILSKGYGKKNRMRRVITKTEVVRALDLPVRQRNSVFKLYGHDADMKIIVIHLEPELLLL